MSPPRLGHYLKEQLWIKTTTASRAIHPVTKGLLASLGLIRIFSQTVQESEKLRWLADKEAISVRKFTTACAIPSVAVGRIIEHGGSLRLRNGHGSGMISLVWNVSPDFSPAGSKKLVRAMLADVEVEVSADAGGE
jgi:hypothetical protein